MSARVLGLVPARGGSRRAPGKNLAVLGGRTLVHRALATASAADGIDLVALSSDADDILAEAEHVTGAVALRRPAALATDEAVAVDVANHALHALEESGAGRFDAVAIVQATSPFTSPDDVTGAVALWRERGSGSVVTVCRVEHAVHPLKLKRMEGDRLIPWLADDRAAPAHELPELWVRNGSVYVTERSVLERGSLLADDTRGYRMPPERSLDVNTPMDLAFAAFLMQQGAS